MKTPGHLFRDAVTQHQPLIIPGAINAYCALMAEHAGHHALYLSGAGVANASHGLPDLGMTNLNDVLIDAQRITAASQLPLLVDIDTGFGEAFGIARTIREMERAGVAAVHMEDQVAQKRCGHRPNKQLVTQTEMCDRLKAALDARTDESFVIMARTDSIASEGLNKALERMQAYVDTGADMIFAEAVTTLSDYKMICNTLKVPVLANITEFGKTPLFTQEELGEAGLAMVLYPLTAFRMMNKAAETSYETLLRENSQESLISQMQTREELYTHLSYHAFEDKLDKLFKEKK